MIVVSDYVFITVGISRLVASPRADQVGLDPVVSSLELTHDLQCKIWDDIKHYYGNLVLTQILEVCTPCIAFVQIKHLGVDT